jgi:putative membrane-bound dehydrogenase-like protein
MLRLITAGPTIDIGDTVIFSPIGSLAMIMSHDNRTRFFMISVLLTVAFSWHSQSAQSEQWIRHELSRSFYSEGGSCADIDKDGHVDLIAGQFVYYGPDFKQKSVMYEANAYSINGYSNNFLAYAHDINQDGWTDMIVFDFPGAQTWYLQNPGKDVRTATAWPRYTALDITDNESPMLTDITGDGKPEIVCCHGGCFGYAEIPADPTQMWQFKPVSENGNYQRFTHGIGVGDVNDDGKLDMMAAHGWWQNPGETSKDASSTWKFSPYAFAGTSAQMYAADFDGDGQNEVISSHQAHGYGLNMFDKVANKASGGWEWNTQALMTDKADSITDIVTGKRFWAHQGHDPGENETPYLVWFQSVRLPNNSVRFEPHIIDEDSGVGTQITVYDVNKDGKLDVFSASKRGVHLFLQTTDDDPNGNLNLAAAQDKLFATSVQNVVAVDDTIGGFRPADDAGQALNFDFEAGSLKDWRGSGAAFFNQPVRGDAVAARRNDMRSNHQGEFWVGSFEVCLDIAQGTLQSRPFRVNKPWISFLIAGGSSKKSMVEIVDLGSNEVLMTQVGTDHEMMKRAVIDAAKLQGKDVFIRLSDTGTEGWGHINFDDFRLHDSEPKIADGERVSKLDDLLHDRLSPEDVAAAMTLPEGFTVQVAAAEPDVQQPVAMTIDERGRMWVVEAYEYPTRAAGDKGRDRILIFEDTDQNGSFDSRKVFYQGLNLATGIEVGFGGVFVGAAPYLYFIADANKDDVPDSEPKIELEGWAYQDTHETLNSFIWGPDGWLYGCHGVFTHSNVKVYGSDKPAQPINAGIWRFHPARKEFEVFAHGTSNPWGVDFDSRGQCFLTACVIPHLYHVIQGARYERQAGQHFNPFTYEDIKTIAIHRHWLGDNPHGGNNRSDSAGGGHAHSGAMIYQGASWPEKYHDQIFMNNIHGARLNQDQLTRQGSGYVGNRAPDFLFANDRSSQILYFRYGPDGQVYAIDWYDIQQCHTKKNEDHDRGNGRIYRIAYNNTPPAKVDLNKFSNAQLVEALLHDNQWYARTARRLLQERSSQPKFDDTVNLMRTELLKQFDTAKQLNIIWTLAACGAFDEVLLDMTLSSEDQYVRSWGIQLATEHLGNRSDEGNQSLVKKFAKLSGSTRSEPVDRLYLLSAALRLPINVSAAIVQNALGRFDDSADHNLPLMAWYNVSRIAESNPLKAAELAERSKLPLVKRFLMRQISSSDDREAMSIAMRMLDAHATSDQAEGLLKELLVGLSTRKSPTMPADWPKVREAIAKNTNADAVRLSLGAAAKFREQAAIDKLASIAVDKQDDAPNRLFALNTLRDIREPRLSGIVSETLKEAALRPVSINAMADDLNPQSAQQLVDAMKGWSLEDRRLAIYTLSRRSSTANVLANAIKERTIGVSELSADMMEQLSQLKGFDGITELKEIWSASRQSVGEASKQIAQLKSIIDQHADQIDLADGKALFTRTCGQCHQLFGEGAMIGPELTGSNRKDLDYLFSNIVTPSAVMAKEYQPWIVQTDDGRVVTGLLKQKTSNSIVLQTTTEVLTLYTDEVEGMKQSEQSMMPENLLTTLDKQQIANLVGYLRSTKAVATK